MQRITARPVPAALAGATAISFSAIFYRLADVSPSTGAFFRCAYALPPLVVLAALEDRRFGPRPPGDRAIALIAGILFAVDLIVWNHAIDAVGAGLATVLGNSQVVIVGLLAWALLGERPSGRALVTVPVVMVGIVHVSGVVGSGEYGSNPGLGVAFGVATAFAYSAFLLLLRQSSRDLRRVAGPLFEATAAATAGVAVFGLATGDLDLTPSAAAQGWLVLLALSSQVVGWLLITVSLPRLPAAITSILLTFQPVGSVMFAAAILGESPSALQLIGAATILAGLLLASSGRRDVRAPDLRRGSAAEQGKPVADLGLE